jgi:Flp pilus assembly pilin Flp
MVKTIVRLLIHDVQGQDLIEHAMIAGLISILSIIAANVVRGL